MNLIEKWDEIPQKTIDTLAMAIFEAAADVFEVCGAESDFCVQSVTATSAVFGGTNRLIWWPARGFLPSRKHCTERFLREWDAHYGRP